MEGRPLLTGSAPCVDVTAAQTPVWVTAVNLGIVTPYSTGYCAPNDLIVRAEASKILAVYANTVTGTMNIISPSVQTFPDVLLAMWYFNYVESMYNGMGSIYAIAGNNFYPGDSLTTVDGQTWINNLP
ncbi:MAG: hypothetical protein Q8P68_01150 [Candidatus Peregrinibacteria bacterium]|nr:hypothetical protein [Candidatus Peregrinibacteria bacterium]